MNKETQNNELSTDKALHIAVVMGSFKLKLQERLVNVKKDQTWDDWEEGIKFGREDMLEEIIDMIDKGYLNCP
jgi:hypothetical protein